MNKKKINKLTRDHKYLFEPLNKFYTNILWEENEIIDKNILKNILNGVFYDDTVLDVEKNTSIKESNNYPDYTIIFNNGEEIYMEESQIFYTINKLNSQDVFKNIKIKDVEIIPKDNYGNIYNYESNIGDSSIDIMLDSIVNRIKEKDSKKYKNDNSTLLLLTLRTPMFLKIKYIGMTKYCYKVFNKNDTNNFIYYLSGLLTDKFIENNIDKIHNFDKILFLFCFDKQLVSWEFNEYVKHSTNIKYKLYGVYDIYKDLHEKESKRLKFLNNLNKNKNIW